MRPKNPSPATYNFGYARPPRSGNEINGLGNNNIVKPIKIGPDDFMEDYEYKSLFDFFFMTLPWPVFKEYLKGIVHCSTAIGKVAEKRIEVSDPAEMATTIKEKAIEFGAGIAGVTLATDELLLYEDDEPYPYKYVICLGTEMDRKAMENVPQPEAGLEIVRCYGSTSKCANNLAHYIRSLGWGAEAFAHGRDILQIPAAIQAGLGELGKHGSLISKEFGSNFRLSLVLTDLPMAIDKPADYGIEDVCLSCQRCVKDCPPDAISNDKHMVRGVEKWYVDFDKCAYYFTKEVSCSICIEVCPWSEPGRGEKLSITMLAKRHNITDN